MILYALIFFILGTIIGSFLNVVALRYNTGRTFLGGRSECFSCGHILAWYELIPLFSFLILRGRCYKCKSKISFQYPIVEFLTGLIFLGTFLKYFPIKMSVILAQAGIQDSMSILWIPAFAGMTVWFFLLLDLIVFSFLIVILIYDLKHKIIPDVLVYSFIVLSFLRLLFLLFFIPHSTFHILDLLAGPLMFTPFFLLWFLSGGRWMGFGDAKLALGIGWFLGFVGATSAIILGFWIGAAVGIALLIREKLGGFRLKEGRKKLTMKSEIPFAPFLIIGLWLVYFFQMDVFGLSVLLFQQ